MVQAIALLALLEAARHGEYCASFHGFRVQALRHRSGRSSDAFVEVNLYVSLGENLVERSQVAMDMQQQPGAMLAARLETATIDIGTTEPKA